MSFSFKKLQEVSLRNKYTCLRWITNHEKILTLSSIVPYSVKVICVLYFKDDDIFNKTSSKGGIIQSSNNKMITRIDPEEAPDNDIKFQEPMWVFHYPHNVMRLNGNHRWKDLQFKGGIIPYNNNHGMAEISSTQQARVQWDLKVNKLKPNNIYRADVGCILIGIASQDDHVDQHIHDGNTIYYLFQWNIGQKNMDCISAHTFYFTCKDKANPGPFTENYTDNKYHNDNSSDEDRISIHLDLKQAKIKLIVNGFDLHFRQVKIMQSKQIKYKLCVILDSCGESVEILNFKIY